MVESDFQAFTELLDDVMSLNPAWKPLGPKAKALYFKALEPYPLASISKAMTAHIRDSQCGMFQPTPAHIVGQIEAMNGANGRPGAEEAWSISMSADDEAETVVWTDEMQQAFAICRPVLQAGDKIGARMAFKDAYIRLVTEANRQGRPAKWNVSLGHDATKREATIVRAAIAGLLPAPQAKALLPGRDIGPADKAGLERVKAAVAMLQDPTEKLEKARAEAIQAEREAVTKRKAELAAQTQQSAGNC